MNKKRYLLAVYLLLASISIVMALVALNYLNEFKDVQGLLLNLSTEIAGAVLIFLVVNRMFFIGDNSEIFKSINTLSEKANNSFNPLRAHEKAINSDSIFKNNVEGTDTLDMLGYTLPPSIRRNRGHIINLLKNGTVIRLIIVDTESDSARLISEHHNEKLIIDYNISIKYIKKINNEVAKYKGKIEVNAINWIPSCSMYIINKHIELNSSAKISIYPPSTVDLEKNRRIIEINKRTYLDDFNYFSKQFNILWENSIPIKI